MSNFSSAEYILSHNIGFNYSEGQVRATEAQAHAALAVAEAQQTANLIAFLEWADEQPEEMVTPQEYADVVTQVKERIK